MNKVSISTLALIAVLGAGLVACTDDDVSYGGNVASGGVIYGDNFHDHNYPYPGYYPGPIHGGGGFHDGGHDGGFHGGGDHGPGPGGPGGGMHGNPGGGFGGGGFHGGAPGGGFGGGGMHGGHPAALVTDNAALANAMNVVDASAPVVATTFQSTDARVQHVAAQYSISEYAATYVVRAIVMAQTKDMSGLQAIGLDTNDFADLYNGRDLSSDKINTLATTLKMPTVAAQALIQDMQSDIQAQQKKINN